MNYTCIVHDPVVSVVDTEKLASWLGDVPDTDPVLAVVGTLATSYVINYLQFELLERARTLVYQNWPYIGTSTYGISPPDAHFLKTIELPYAKVGDVENVEVNGEEADDYEVLQTLPLSICFPGIPSRRSDCQDPALVVDYTAGWEELDDVPEEIRLAALMVAAFIYEHRGCDAMDAINKSGAGDILFPYKAKAIVI